MADIHLIRDVLDNQIVDARKRQMGRVDGIVIRLQAGAPPRVVALEVGPVTLLRRVSDRLARLLARLLSLRGLEGSHRLPPSRVHHVGLDLDTDLDADTAEIEHIQRLLRDRVLARIPGSGAKHGAR